MPSTEDSPLDSGIRDQPWLAAAIGGVLIVLVAYAALILQQLLVVLWILTLLFFAYLALRFVRAVERIAGAAEAVADRRE